MAMRALGIRAIALLSITSILILSVGILPAAYAPRPSFVDQVTCGVNEGWASPPNILILTGTLPSPITNDAGGTVGAVDLVKDAAVEYWDEGANQDGEPENGANSDFKNPNFGGFGSVTTAGSGSSDITITFTALPSGTFGTASCTIDQATGNIVSATIKLTTSVGSLNDENYKNAAAHELGHAIGLSQHSGPPGTLMFKFLSSSDAYLPLSKQSQRGLTNLYG